MADACSSKWSRINQAYAQDVQWESRRGLYDFPFQFLSKIKAGSLANARYRWIPTCSTQTTFPGNVRGKIDHSECILGTFNNPLRALEGCAGQSFMFGSKQVAVLVVNEWTGKDDTRVSDRNTLFPLFFYTRSSDIRGGR